MDRYQEIERRLRAGRGLREIARASGCSRRTVREVRDGLRGAPSAAPASPLWTRQVDWTAAREFAAGERVEVDYGGDP